jgi:hypothetical protein
MEPLLAVDRNPGQPLQAPKSLQHWYDGNTTVISPCGATVSLAPNYQPICDLGTMGLVDDRANGLFPGIGTNSAYGSVGTLPTIRGRSPSMPSCCLEHFR